MTFLCAIPGRGLALKIIHSLFNRIVNGIVKGAIHRVILGNIHRVFNRSFGKVIDDQLHQLLCLRTGNKHRAVYPEPPAPERSITHYLLDGFSRRQTRSITPQECGLLGRQCPISTMQQNVRVR